MGKLEQSLASTFGFETAVMFGKARSGVVALLEALGPAGRQIIMPATICPSLIAAARAAGADVKLCDIDPAHGLADDTEMAALVRALDTPGIVMPTYLYGYVCDYSLTIKAAQDLGWFVLHNDTHGALGHGQAFLEQSPSSGLLVSFGAGKVIDAQGGGAVLLNDRALAQELLARSRQYPAVTQKTEAFEDYLTLLRRILRQGPAGGERSLAGRYEHFLDLDTTLTKFSFSDDQRPSIQTALNAHPHECARRQESCVKWRTHLAPYEGKLQFPKLSQPSPWRMIIRIPKFRDHIVAALRDLGIDAGTNYPSVSIFYPTMFANKHFPGAQIWSEDVLNLWLNSNYDDNLMAQTAAVIGSSMQQ